MLSASLNETFLSLSLATCYVSIICPFPPHTWQYILRPLIYQSWSTGEEKKVREWFVGSRSARTSDEPSTNWEARRSSVIKRLLMAWTVLPLDQVGSCLGSRLQRGLTLNLKESWFFFFFFFWFFLQIIVLSWPCLGRNIVWIRPCLMVQ